MRRLALLLFAATAAHASVTLTVTPTGSTTPTGAYVRMDIANCTNPTVVNSNTKIPVSRQFKLNGAANVTFTVEDNVTQIACNGNQLSYYTATYVANGVQTQLKSVELPPGIFSLENLAALSGPPWNPGVIQGPVGPSGPVGPPGCILGQNCTGGFTGTLLSAFASLQAASDFCAGLSGVCDLVIDGPYTAAFSVSVASNANIHCVQNGMLTISAGATVTVNSGNAQALPGQQCFSGMGSLAGLQMAMPDWFAPKASGSYPTSAMRKAYAATVAGAEIRFSPTNYLSDFLYNGGFATSSRWWHGAGRPYVDQIGTTSGPQRMVDGSGTVIQGMFVVTSSDTTISDLGIDYGAWVIANKYGGTVPFAQNGLQSVGNANSGTVAHNMNWRNVASLVVAQGAAHTMLIENYDGCSVDGAWVYQPAPTGSTPGWGFIDKSQNCTYRNINVYGANAGGVYSKSDHATNTNGHASNNHFTSVHLNSATTAHDGGRFLIHGAAGDSNNNSQIDGIWINDSAAGITDMTDGGGSISGWVIHGLHTTNMYGASVFLNSAKNTSIEDVSTATNAFDGNGSVFIGASSTGDILRNLRLSGTGTNPYGLINNASDTKVENVSCVLTNYCIFGAAGLATVRGISVSGAIIGSAPYYSFGTYRILDFTGNFQGSVTIGGSAIAAGTCSTVVSPAIPGAALGNGVQFLVAAPAGFYFQASARTDIVDVVLCNATPASATPTSASYAFKVIQ